jgi:hypothetical protein
VSLPSPPSIVAGVEAVDLSVSLPSSPEIDIEVIPDALQVTWFALAVVQPVPAVTPAAVSLTV